MNFNVQYSTASDPMVDQDAFNFNNIKTVGDSNSCRTCNGMNQNNTPKYQHSTPLDRLDSSGGEFIKNNLNNYVQPPYNYNYLNPYIQPNIQYPYINNNAFIPPQNNFIPSAPVVTPIPSAPYYPEFHQNYPSYNKSFNYDLDCYKNNSYRYSPYDRSIPKGSFHSDNLSTSEIKQTLMSPDGTEQAAFLYNNLGHSYKLKDHKHKKHKIKFFR